MARARDAISEELADWMLRQHVFFVASAPLSGQGHVNCSPKGLETFRVLGPRAVAYLDLTGSGIETVSHLKENGRIVLMFCAFEGAPKVVRLQGHGTVLAPGETAFNDLRSRFPDLPGIRSIIHINVTRISDSCGFGVPQFQFVGERDQLPKWCATKGEPQLADYRKKHNSSNVDGLPGI